MPSSACVPLSRPNVHASTPPGTRSALTICEFSRGAISRDRAQNYGLGTYPAMPRPLRGSSASWSPFLFAAMRHRRWQAAMGAKAKNRCQIRTAGVELGATTGRGGCHEAGRWLLLRPGALRGRGRANDESAMSLPRMPIHLRRLSQHVYADATRRLWLYQGNAQTIFAQRP